MAKKKVYAVKEGYNTDTEERVQNLLVHSWDECLKYTKGVKGAIYKSFEKEEDAQKFLSENSKLLRKNKDEYPNDCLHIYVDGSCNSEGSKYSYGVVAVRDNTVEYIEGDFGNSSKTNNVRQIAGELKGAIQATKYALSKGDKKIVLFHDYEGICHHATGFWQRKDPLAVRYYTVMQDLMKHIEIIFVQVNSHQGDLFNELVDSKCKLCLDIKNDKAVEKWLSNNIINVSSHDIKIEIIKMISKGEDNIIVINTTDNDSSAEDIAVTLEHSEAKSEAKVECDSDAISAELDLIISNLSLDKKIQVLDYIKTI